MAQELGGSATLKIDTGDTAWMLAAGPALDAWFDRRGSTVPADDLARWTLVFEFVAGWPPAVGALDHPDGLDVQFLSNELQRAIPADAGVRVSGSTG